SLDQVPDASAASTGKEAELAVADFAVQVLHQLKRMRNLHPFDFGHGRPSLHIECHGIRGPHPFSTTSECAASRFGVSIGSRWRCHEKVKGYDEHPVASSGADGGEETRFPVTDPRPSSLANARAPIDSVEGHLRSGTRPSPRYRLNSA